MNLLGGELGYAVGIIGHRQGIFPFFLFGSPVDRYRAGEDYGLADDLIGKSADVLRPPDIGLEVVPVGKAGDAAQRSQVEDMDLATLTDNLPEGLMVDGLAYVGPDVGDFVSVLIGWNQISHDQPVVVVAIQQIGREVPAHKTGAAENDRCFAIRLTHVTILSPWRTVKREFSPSCIALFYVRSERRP